MGSDTSIQAIGFETIISADANASIAEMVAVNAVNWAYTNWRGMLFGLLIGALLLCILPFLQKFKFKNPILNSLNGVLIGAPLGVCANCATPIAKGMIASGTRSETALATLVSSPTLNIVVLTMSFSLLPMHLAIIKVLFTIGFILLVIPLITRHFTLNSDLGSLTTSTATNPISESFSAAPSSTWGKALITAFALFFKNSVYIVKTTVPLMLLAGLLGSLCVTLLPLDTLVDKLPDNRLLFMLPWMIVVALIGLFLPTPMAFDVIVTAILINAGLPVGYAMVLLFTLGIFSIYPFSVIFQSSKGVACSMVLALLALAMTTGVIADRYQPHHEKAQQAYLLDKFTGSSIGEPSLSLDRITQSTPFTELSTLLSNGSLSYKPFIENDHLTVTRSIYSNDTGTKPIDSSAPPSALFSQLNTDQLGFNERDNFSVLKLLERYARSRGVASGDVHNDGWPDIVIASESGFGLYANLQGQRFIQQRISIPELDRYYVSNVALVDLNNNGWHDLVFSTFKRGVFVIYNDNGEFLANRLKQLTPNLSIFVTSSLAFSDFDRNGELDIHLGNTGVGNAFAKASYEKSRNFILMQHDGEFSVRPSKAIPGESLTSLVTDLNGDRWPDLIVGNEFDVSDAFFLNDASGALNQVPASQKLIPYTSSTTMSISSADINNDLNLELFFAQRSWNDQPRVLDKNVICAEVNNVSDRQHCLNMLSLREVRQQAIQQGDFKQCKKLGSSQLIESCIALQVVHQSNPRARNSKNRCDLLASKWPSMHQYCNARFEPTAEVKQTELNAQIPQVAMRNILLEKSSNSEYQDTAKKWGLEHGGWSWNATFADLDNDTWQDLFIATGDLMVRTRHPSFLYRNLAGERFENITQGSGLESIRDFLSYTYIDYDNDGDLDILAIPAAGKPELYRNNSRNMQSIKIELNDQQANRSVIGSRVVIGHNGKKQLREIKASGGFQSFDAPTAHFGLGDSQSIDFVEITWPDGNVTSISRPLPSGSSYKITRQ